MPPPPQPPKKSFPVSQFQQGPAQHSHSATARLDDPHARRGGGGGAGESAHGVKRAREEQGQVGGEGDKAGNSKKKPKSFLPLNTFAPDHPAPKPAPNLPKAPPAALPPAPKLQRLPPPPPRAAPHRDPVKKRLRGAAAVDLTAEESEDDGAPLEMDVAGPSKVADPKERQLKTFTAFQRTDTPTKPSPKTPVSLKPLPQFGNSSKATSSDRKPKKPLGTPPRAKPLYHSEDPPPSPLKPLLSTPPSARAASLFKSLPAPKVKEEIVGGKSLLERVPPMPREVANDDEDTRDGIPDSWSPKKKKGGHILMGLASRASSILSSARTAQTLWLHNLSRQLTAHTQDQALTLPLLHKLLHPDVRLSVIEVLPFGSSKVDSSAPTSSPSLRDERKIILARCRLAPLDGELVSPSRTPYPGLETPGLVLFSLNEHPPASSQLGGIPPRKKRDPEDNTRTVFVLSNPHDLRFIAEGAEVWIWDPLHKISLSTAFAEQELGAGVELQGAAGSMQQPPASVLDDAGCVFWDSRTKEEREAEREARERRARPKSAKGEPKEWALVCGRFAVVV